MTVYTVWYDSDDYYEKGGVIEIFSSRELAQSFVDHQKERERRYYSIEEYVIDSAISTQPN